VVVEEEEEVFLELDMLEVPVVQVSSLSDT
jgi:hypothetical protein